MYMQGDTAQPPVCQADPQQAAPDCINPVYCLLSYDLAPVGARTVNPSWRNMEAEQPVAAALASATVYTLPSAASFIKTGTPLPACHILMGRACLGRPSLRAASALLMGSSQPVLFS